VLWLEVVAGSEEWVCSEEVFVVSDRGCELLGLWGIFGFDDWLVKEGGIAGVGDACLSFIQIWSP